MKRPSQRFSPSKWSRLLVPAVLVLLLLGLLANVALAILSAFGLI